MKRRERAYVITAEVFNALSKKQYQEYGEHILFYMAGASATAIQVTRYSLMQQQLSAS